MKTFSLFFNQLPASCLIIAVTILLINCDRPMNDPSETVLIPDMNFEQALVTAQIDKDGQVNGHLALENVINLKILRLDDSQIMNLTGIEAFQNLEELYLNNNKLTSLNLVRNTNLKILQCNHNQLTTLNVSANHKLEQLECGFNILSDLNTISLTKLIKLYCFNNQLKTVELSTNVSLEDISLNQNQLTSLDFSRNTHLKSISCAYNQLAVLNVSQLANLLGLSCNNNQLKSLDLRSIPHLTNLVSSTNQIVTICVDDLNAAIRKSTLLNSAGYTDWIKDPSTSFATCK